LVIRTLLFAFVFPLLLAACKSELQAPETAPANFRVTAGDSQAVLTWDIQPGQIYSVYYQAGPTVSLDNYVGFATNVVSPFTVTGLTDQTQYAFIVNASNDGSVPGPSTPVVTVTPGGTGLGQEWTVGGALTGDALHSVAFGNQTYVAVGDNGSLFTANVSTTSSSGIGSWNPHPSLLPTGLDDLGAVVFTGSRFVAMAYTGLVMTSLDGVNWAAATPISGTAQPNALAFGNGTLVAVGVDGSIRTNNSAIASAQWVSRSVTLSDNTLDFFGVSYVNGVFIAVGENGLLATSTDNGVTWTAQTSGITNKRLFKAAYAGGVYVVVGDSGTILSSPDAVNWVQETPPTSSNFYGIAYGVNAEFVIVGTGGTVLSSPVGTDGTWTAATAGSGSMNDVVAGNGVFVAVGDGGANFSGK
jgi:hypothetical protein